MRIGTRSVLFGVHQFLLHPVLLFVAWWKLYGFPWDPRLWLAFFVHDLGYLGKPNMDGLEGEAHPILGARIMGLFGQEWHDLVLLHSRYFAAAKGRQPSRLCYADKLVIVLEPSWLYLPRAWASGELEEFLEVAATRGALSPNVTAAERAGYLSRDPWQWHAALKSYMRRWLCEHVAGGEDGWTVAREHSSHEQGAKL